MPGPWHALRALAAPEEERPGRRRALRLVGLAIVVAFAAVAAARVDLRAVARSVVSARPGLVALALAGCLAGLVVHAYRWASVVPSHGRRVEVRAVFDAMVAGFAVAIVMPAIAGDLVRAHLLARRAGLSTASVVGAAAVDFVVGTATLIPLIVVTGVATPLPDWARHALLVTSIAAAAGVALVLLLRPARAPAGAEGPGPAPRGLLARVRAGLAAAHDPVALARCVAWGLAGWGAELAMAWACLAAVDVEPTVPLASLVVVATAVANAAAVSPGNAGPFELAAMLPVTAAGVAPAPALAFALLLHVVHLAPAAALGGVVLLREARGEDGAALRAGEEAR
jgi:uncharacterized membrane protein YbhN (UPF0104 family)